MSLVTLSIAKHSRLKRIASSCPNSSQFLDLLNDGTRELMKRGPWWNCTKKIRVCSYDGCFAWPEWVGTVLATNIDGNNRPMSNHWYEFLDLVGHDANPNRIWPSNVMVIDDGTTPVMRNIPCNGSMYVRAYCRRSNDIGKTLTVYGVDNTGNVAMSTWPDGTYREGYVLSFANPFASTPKPMREITRVAKDETEGPIDLYSYDAVSNNLIELSHYRPSETEPNYRHNTVDAWSSIGCGRSVMHSITAMIRLEFVPVVNDEDVVLIEDLDALALAMQSVKLSDANDSAGAEAMMSRAVHELQLQMDAKYPRDQISITASGFGTAVPARAGIGRIL